MEAPEKIYVHVKGDKVTNTWNSTWIGVHDIEYIRKDAFIEKAVKHIDGLIEFLNEFGHQLKKERIIEDFKNYMKGE